MEEDGSSDDQQWTKMDEMMMIDDILSIFLRKLSVIILGAYLNGKCIANNLYAENTVRIDKKKKELFIEFRTKLIDSVTYYDNTTTMNFSFYSSDVLLVLKLQRYE